MTAANYIALAALAVSLIVGLVNITNTIRNSSRAERDDRKKGEEDARREQEEQTRIMIALDHIKEMLTDIKGELNSVKQDTKENHDNLLILAETQKNDHERIEKHEERLKYIEETLRGVRG